MVINNDNFDIFVQSITKLKMKEDNHHSNLEDVIHFSDTLHSPIFIEQNDGIDDNFGDNSSFSFSSHNKQDNIQRKEHEKVILNKNQSLFAPTAIDESDKVQVCKIESITQSIKKLKAKNPQVTFGGMLAGLISNFGEVNIEKSYNMIKKAWEKAGQEKISESQFTSIYNRTFGEKMKDFDGEQGDVFANSSSANDEVPEEAISELKAKINESINDKGPLPAILLGKWKNKYSTYNFYSDHRLEFTNSEKELWIGQFCIYDSVLTCVVSRTEENEKDLEWECEIVTINKTTMVIREGKSSFSDRSIDHIFRSQTNLRKYNLVDMILCIWACFMVLAVLASWILRLFGNYDVMYELYNILLIPALLVIASSRKKIDWVYNAGNNLVKFWNLKGTKKATEYAGVTFLGSAMFFFGLAPVIGVIVLVIVLLYRFFEFIFLTT